MTAWKTLTKPDACSGSTFDDGNVEAVMAVYKYKDGKIFSLETGATNMPK